jgi:hypothetical protein
MHYKGNQFTAVDTEVVSVEPFWHGYGGFYWWDFFYLQNKNGEIGLETA